MILTSPCFNNNQKIPQNYTCSGEDVNPELHIEDIPKEAKSLVLIVDDPDAPSGNWVHWIVWNVPIINLIKENSCPGIVGVNDFRKNSYNGPCPPSGTHRYYFKVYALDIKLDLSKNSSKKEVLNAMKNNVLAEASIVGLYQRFK